MKKPFDHKWIQLLLLRHEYVFLFMLLLAFVTRFFLLFPSVIGHDESTYLVIANEWLKGNIPFVHLIDIKPLGIYGLFLINTLIFGRSIIAIRLLTVVVIAATGYFLYRAKYSYGGSKQYGLFTGALYIILISIHPLGWTSNTEIFFVFFTALGLWKMQKLNNARHYLAFGLCMGMGFIFKYHVLFDTVVFGLYLLSLPDRKLIQKISLLTTSAIGFLIPIATCFLSYYAAGYFDEFLNGSFVIPSNYDNYMSFGKKMGFIGQLYIYFPVLTICYVITIFYHVKMTKLWFVKENILFFLWPLFVWVAILMTGKRFWHYYIQAFLPFCFFAIDGLKYLKNPFPQNYRNKALVAISFILILITLTRQYITIGTRHDSGKEVANFLRPRMNEDTKIYAPSHTILYYLLDKSSPTRYVHASLIYNADHLRAFGINQKEEFQGIMDYEPHYVVTTGNGKAFLVDWLKNNYRLIKTFSDAHTVWKKIE